jgi:DNA-binding transcriptional regulator GbsR (MarR family)
VSEKVFSAELEQFIASEINSLEQLEILLLLSGNPHKWWTAGGVYEVIKSSVQSVQDRLNEMTGRGLLRKEIENEIRYQFAPTTDEVWKITSELRDAYKERSVKVVQAIYSKPPDAVQEFARAFRLRKDK